MEKDSENSKLCCVCKEKSSRRKNFPCGHNICCMPCLENLKLLYTPDDPKCPLCTLHSPLYMTTAENDCIDTMPRRPAPLPPEYDDRYYVPPRNSPPQENHKCQCRKVSVRIFCKGACYKSEVNSLMKMEDKNASLDDGDPEVKNFSERLRKFKEREQNLPGKIQEAREVFVKMMNNVREEIRDTARAYHEKVVEEENRLLQELGEVASASCKYYMNLYDDYDELLVKEYELLDRVNEWKSGRKDNESKSGHLASLKDMEMSLNELMTKMKRLETQGQRRECNLEFTKLSPKKDILGKLNRTGNAYETFGQAAKDVLKTFQAKKKQDVFLHKFCVGVVWLDDTKCVAVLDKTSSAKCFTFQIMSMDGEDIVLHPNPAVVERRPGRAIHVCSSVGPDRKSLLLSIGKEVLRVRLDSCSGKNPSVVSTTFAKPVQAVSWAQTLTEYFILTYQPWKISLVDDKNSYSVFRSLTSTWYGPFLYTIGTSVVVGDITKNVFKIYDQSNVQAPVQICPSRSLDAVSPAAVCFNEKMGEWLLLWKGVSGNNNPDRKWFITRHNQSFEFCGLALNGNLDKGDPRGFTVHNNKLLIFYHGGNVAIFQINSFSITPS